MLTLGELFGLAAAAALVGLGLWHVARGLLDLRGTRLVICPDDGRTALVTLDLRYSAGHPALRGPRLRVAGCSRWPQKARCGQMCLGDLEAARRPTARAGA